LGIDFSPDWRVALLTVSITSIAVLATGVGPALRGTRRLVAVGRSANAPLRARLWFLVVQVALSAVLIVSASLLGRGLLRASALDPGFDLDRVATVSLRLPSGQSRDSRAATIRSAVREALTAPGPPMVAEASPSRSVGRVSVVGHIPTTVGPVAARRVSPEYLRLLDVPVREGRLLREDDSPGEVVVNESFAKQAWPGQSAVGSVFAAASPQAGTGISRDGAGASGIPRVVVGVVGDVPPEQARPGAPVPPTFFERGGGDRLYIRNDPVTLDRARTVLRAIEPDAGVEFSSLSAGFEVGLVDMRIGVALAWGLGLIALAMSAAGIFGVFALAAEERRREVGIRLALGAGARAIVQLMLTHAGRALLLGLLLGFVAALLAAPLLRSYLVGVGPHDPIAFAAAGLVLVAAAAAATVIPIRRALRVNPAVTLRAE
jgi:hypothetical protein